MTIKRYNFTTMPTEEAEALLMSETLEGEEARRQLISGESLAWALIEAQAEQLMAEKKAH